MRRGTPRPTGTTVSTPSEGARRRVAGLRGEFGAGEAVAAEPWRSTAVDKLPAAGRHAAGEFERLRYWLYTLEAAVGRTVECRTSGSARRDSMC